MTTFDYNQKLTNIDIRVNEAIDFMVEQARTQGVYSEDQTELMHEAVRELKGFGAQLQTVSRNCANSDNPAQYLLQPEVRRVYEIADALAGHVLETADQAVEAVEQYRESSGPSVA